MITKGDAEENRIDQRWREWWIVSGTSFIGWVMQMAICCYCAGRRDAKLGKKVEYVDTYWGNTALRDEAPREREA